VQHHPQQFWWAITAIGIGTTFLLWIYDLVLRPSTTATGE
jgi:hypothetical protein